MALLIDIFGFLTVVLRGVVVSAQAITLGGIAFLALLALPLGPTLGDGGALVARTLRGIAWASLGLALVLGLRLFLMGAILAETTGLGWAGIVGAEPFVVGAIGIVTALALAVACRLPPARAVPVLVVGGLALLVAAGLTSHAAARFDDRLAIGAAGLVHQLGAAVWIGGIPFFLSALRQSDGTAAIAAVGRRYSLMSMGGVSLIAIGGAAMAFAYFDSPEAVWGTAYGLMVSTKALMFAALLLLGLGNFRVVERLRRDPRTPALRLRRFAEVELGVGLTVFFAAASITSLPPAIDLVEGRATLTEITQRLTPSWPTFTSPDHADLAIPRLQAELDAKAAEARQAAPQAFVPGAGAPPPKRAEDIAWSEYNHHWAGVFVTLIGLLALLERSGHANWARHWPLLFLVLAVFLVVRSDPEAWPLGHIGFLESMRDPEVTQHRIFTLLIILFGLFEWGVRTGRLTSPRAALAFPLLTAIGGAFLLAHNHQLGNVREELLIEYTHVPLALFGIAAGWARWLELRLDGRGRAVAAIVWPLCFVMVGLSLMLYRESGPAL